MEVSLPDGFLSGLILSFFLVYVLSLAVPYILQWFHHIHHRYWNAHTVKLENVGLPLRDDLDVNGYGLIMSCQCRCLHCKATGLLPNCLQCKSISPPAALRDRYCIKCSAKDNEHMPNIDGCSPKTSGGGGSVNVNSNVLTASLQKLENGTSTVAITVNDLFNNCAKEVEVGVGRNCNCNICNTNRKPPLPEF